MRRSCASPPAKTSTEPVAARWGWVAAAMAAAAVAYLGTLLLAPSGDQLLPVADVNAADVFSAAQIERGSGYRGPQTLIGLGSLVAQLIVLAVLAARPPRWLRGLRRPLLGAALVGAALSVVLLIAGLPFAAALRVRAQDVGLSTQSWGGWAYDQLLAAGIGAAFAAVLAVVVLALVRRLPRGWWIPGAGFVVVAAVALTFATPVALDPLFNRFQPLPAGPLREDTLELARAAGLRVERIEVMDASRRTTAANAYVAGLGSSKKIVIYDNLLEDFPRREVRSVLAHELAHERYDDVPRGLLYVALVAPFGVLAIALGSARLAGGRRGTPASLPALALAFLVVSTGIGWISNSLSREVEARADSWALETTRDPAAFAALHRRLALRNVSDPDPPPLVEALFSTHPTTVERLGMARGLSR